MKKKQEEPTMADVTFEQALDRLESLVDQLERGELPLEASLQAFEEGMKLSRLCSRQLEEAEKRVRVLSEGAGGEAVLEDFEGDPGSDPDV